MEIQRVECSHFFYYYQIWMGTGKEADPLASGRRVLENYKYKSQGAVKFFKQAPKVQFRTATEL